MLSMENNYVVVETVDGEKALNCISQEGKTIDLILSDVVMPKMGGIELANKIKTLSPDTKVVLMSGYTEHATENGFGLPKNIAFLEKPFSPSRLRRCQTFSTAGRSERRCKRSVPL